MRTVLMASPFAIKMKSIIPKNALSVFDDKLTINVYDYDSLKI